MIGQAQLAAGGIGAMLQRIDFFFRKVELLANGDNVVQFGRVEVTIGRSDRKKLLQIIFF